MASKMNVKFVAALAGGLSVLFVLVAGLGYMVLRHSGQDYVNIGDKFMAEGNAKEAAKAYANAVGHDRTRIDWIDKWVGALLKTTPETQIEYNESVGRYYQLLDWVATLRSDDAEAQRAYFGAMLKQFSLLGAAITDWQTLVDKVADRYQRLPQGEPATESIRRFGGLARLNLMQSLPDRGDIRESTLADLEAAVAADPTDVEASLGIVQWHTLEWLRYRRERRTDMAAKEYAALNSEIKELRTKHPENLDVLLRDALVRLDGSLQGADTPAQRRAALKAADPIADEVIAAFTKADPASITANNIERLAQVLLIVRQEQGETALLSVLDELVKARPKDAIITRYYAQTLGDVGRYDEAIAAFQRIVDLPDLPVSVEGIYLRYLRSDAVFQQARTWLVKRDRTQDDKERREDLAQAKARRAALVEIVTQGDQSPRVLLLDASIAMSESRPDVAVAKLTQLDSITAETDITKPQVVGMLARALREQGQTGAALDQYDRLLLLQPNNVGAMVEAARASMDVQREDRARARLEQAYALQPDNAEIKGLLELLRAKAGDTNIDDPVVRALAEADKLARQTPPDVDGARAALQKVMADHENDLRVWGAMVQIEAMTGDTDKVRKVVDEALARFPDNERFKGFKDRLDVMSSEDRVAAVIELIDKSDATPQLKALRKAAAYKAAGRDADFKTALAEAAKLAPDDPTVVDTMFVDAIAEKRFDAARALAEKSARLNLDQANGLLYQARLELAQDDPSTALTTLERASEKLPYSAQVWRMLGQVQLDRGQADRAVASLARAYKYQPQDLPIALAYTQTLARLQRNDEALAVAREARSMHPNDKTLADVWAVLEEAVGDRAAAIAERERRHQATPDDRGNTAALVRMYLADKRWADAKLTLEQLRSSGAEPIDVAILEARWNALQGGDGVDKGLEVVKAAIGALPQDKLTAQPYLALAQFLLEFGREEEAMSAFAQAARLQSPEKMEGDRAKGEYLFGAGRIEEALPIYKKLADGVTDPELARTYRIQAAECLVRLGGRWDEAEQELAPLASGAKDVRVLLLQAETARGKGDARRARELLQQAVTIAPNDPRPFVQRAAANFEDPDLRQDVMKDLEQALRLQPTSVIARAMRIELYRRAGQYKEMLAELRKGIETNPTADDLRMQLVRQLLVLGLDADALTATDQAVKDRADSAYWWREAGNVYSRIASKMTEPQNIPQRTDLYIRAVDLYRKADALAHTDTSAYLLASSLLNAVINSPPDRKNIRDKYPAEALKIVDALGDTVETDGLLLAVKGRALYMLAGKDSAKQQDALAVAARGLALIKSNDELREWMSQVQKMIFDDPGIIRYLLTLTPPAKVEPAFMVALSRFQLTDPVTYPDVVKRLDALKTQTADKDVLIDLYRVLGTLQYAQKNYREAADAFGAGAKLDPNDLDFSNNLAFTLAKHLDDAQGALAPAERAVVIAPGSALAMDTLGWIYLQVGRLDQAEATLTKSKDAAKTPVEACPALLHLAAVKLQQGDRVAARKWANEAKDILDLPANRNLRPEYQSDLDTLMQQLNQAE